MLVMSSSPLSSDSEIAAAFQLRPNKPLTREAHLMKFRRNWKAAAISLSEDNGEELITSIDNLEEVQDIRALIDLVTG
jgi:hypothetical protein